MACSGGGDAFAPTASGSAATSATSATAAAPKPTPDQATGTPASAVNPAAQPAAPAGGQPEQRSVQAGGDTGGPVSDAPAAPIVARSKTTGRPITLQVWLTNWTQSTQQLFTNQLAPPLAATPPHTQFQ